MSSLPTARIPFHVGDRVEMHPGTDAWIFGDRYGTVARIGRKYVYVAMSRSGRTLKVHPSRLLEVTNY